MQGKGKEKRKPMQNNNVTEDKEMEEITPEELLKQIETEGCEVQDEEMEEK